MKAYNCDLTFNTNKRGCDIVDTVKGCPGCNRSAPNGCYDGCYASMIARRYGFDFSSPVLRQFRRDDSQLYFAGFSDVAHENDILRRIKKSPMPFVRVGEMGDPSYDWKHTPGVCGVLARAGKPVVIVTKHFSEIPQYCVCESTHPFVLKHLAPDFVRIVEG